MRTAQLKDTLRELKKRWLQILAIFFILTLGIGFFTGIRVTGKNMRDTAISYYQEKELFDLSANIPEPLAPLITKDMIDQVIKDNFPNEKLVTTAVTQYDFTIHVNDNDHYFKGFSYDNTTKKDLTLIKGRLPENKNEIVVDDWIFGLYNLKIDTDIQISDPTFFDDSTFRIVGSVNSVTYLNFDRGHTNIGSGKLDGFFYFHEDSLLPARKVMTSIRIYFDEARNLIPYSKAYDNFINSKVSMFKEFYKNYYETASVIIKPFLPEVNEMNAILETTKRSMSVKGYDSFLNDSNRIEAIGRVFPLIFFLVAALISLTSISRMVEDSRTQSGIYKALGYSSFSASQKFIFIPFVAWIFASIFGSIIGFYVLPSIIYQAYQIMYTTPKLISNFYFSYIWLPILVGFVSSVVIGFVKSIMVSHDKAANLLRPKPPKKGTRILIERITFLWNKLGFLYKVSLRNLFRNKSKFLMTTLGIAGCTGLLITGFGLNDSINDIVKKQFKVDTYDSLVAVNNFDQTARNDFDTYLENNTEISSFTNNHTYVYSFNININNSSVTGLVDLNDTGFKDFYHFKSRGSKKEYTLNNDGIFISEKIAKTYKLKVGNNVTLVTDFGTYEVPIIAVTENYAGHYVYMNKSFFNTNMTTKLDKANVVLFKFNETSNEIFDSFSKQLVNDKKVLSIMNLPDLEKTFDDMISGFNIVIIVIIGAALLLAVFVIVNLVSMNINERIKELATLKVLGFYPKELSDYIVRENVILTILGIALGCAFGFFLHSFVVITAEIDNIMFGRDLYWTSYIYSAIISFVLSIGLSILISFKAHRVDMSTALKSFD